MDVRKLDWSFKDDGSKASSNEPPVNIAFLGTRHPHVMYRFSILENMGGFEFFSFHEKAESIAARLAEVLPNLKRFTSPEALLETNPDIVMIHSLDPDVPQWARFAINHPSPFKGLFLEKPGVAIPEDFYALVKEIRCKRHELVIELGYEMHYSEAMEFARKVAKEGVIGDITTARFHGGCPSEADMNLWQSTPKDLGGIMQTEGCHTLENIVDLSGPPERVVSSIRKLPERPSHPVVGWIPDLFSGTVTTDAFGVGTLMYADIVSAMMEYPDKTVTIDMMAWEPTEWCNEWGIDIYGTNGSSHAVPDYPVAERTFVKGEVVLMLELPIENRVSAWDFERTDLLLEAI